MPADNVYSAFTALAVRTGAVNLGQGFPDDSPPPRLVAAAVRALQAGHHQYPPTRGVPELRVAVAEHQRRRYGVALDPDSEVVVTTGASEAITAALLAHISPGDEVVVIDPCYDLYPGAVALAGAQLVRAPDIASLDKHITGRTRAIVLNSPSNPTGILLSRAELAWVGKLAEQHDLLVVSDEVYEHVVLDGAVHVSAHEDPRLRERAIVVSSAAKTFCVTGWKVGWATGPAHLIDGVHDVKQYLSFASGTPFQHAVAEALADPEESVVAMCAAYEERRDHLARALEGVGYRVSRPLGGYFLMADAAPLGVHDASSLQEHCEQLPSMFGIVGIPGSVFTQQDDVTTVRFCFAKSNSRVEEAVARLHAAARREAPGIS